eukprot:TRINITY_DN100722_c0_g1_i1.p1 TRINITY_DN100722_c0_g1~~TRINITY_DN100722_c0_g1_i1.p1  ORF type:complete len:525 (+),score=200.68 TRINITY_DN100722_c0_g1_i1:149-1723(+)
MSSKGGPTLKGANKKEAQKSFFESLYVSLAADASAIDEDLYLGAAGAGEDRAAMQKKRITHVLICHPTLKEPHPKYFKYGRACLADAPDYNLLEHLPDAVQFLLEARQSKGRIFVCCMKGISRSSSVVIASMMVHRGLSFDEAWKVCEQKRPVVYPNVGFQQQLKHVEQMLSVLPPTAKWEDRLQHLRSGLQGCKLEGTGALLQIGDLIATSMAGQLVDLEGVVEKVFRQPQLLQQKELWKRHGLYFENFHKYKALPSDPELLGRAKEAMEKLRKLPKIYSDAVKGVKLGLAVAKEIESWAKWAEPEFAKKAAQRKLEPPEEKVKPKKAPKEANGKAAEKESGGDTAQPSEVPDWVLKGLGPSAAAATGNAQPKGAASSSSDSSEDGKKKKKKGKKDKKSKKDKKAKDKKEKKLAKKMEKAAEKANKLVAKIDKAAQKAESVAEKSRRQAEEAAEKAAQIEKELEEAEAADKGSSSSDDGSGKKTNAKRRRKDAASSSASPKRPRGGALERRPAMEAYDDLQSD